jgi:hypothetical protein
MIITPAATLPAPGPRCFVFWADDGVDYIRDVARGPMSSYSTTNPGAAA